MLNANASNKSVQDLESEVQYRTRLQEIGNKINAASNLDDILIGLQDDITSLFNAHRVTVYVADASKEELVSRVKSGDDVTEGRIRVSTDSIAGYSAFKEKIVNIKSKCSVAGLLR